MEENPRVQAIARKERFAFDKDGKPVSKNKVYQLRDGLFEAIIDRFYKDSSLCRLGRRRARLGRGVRGVPRDSPRHCRITGCSTPPSRNPRS